MLTQIAIVLAAQTKEPVLSPEVLIALVGAIGTLATGVTAIISAERANRSSLQRETLQWQRSVREQRRQEALSICEDLAAATTGRLLRESSYDLEGLFRVMSKVQLHTSERVAKAAEELYVICSKAEAVRAEVYKELKQKGAQALREEDEEKLAAETTTVARKRHEFIKIAREEYGYMEIS